MKYLIKVIMLMLLAGSTVAIAEPDANEEPAPITLSAQGDIKSAIELSDAIDAISKKVMACNNENAGPVKECDCSDLATCKFKSEYRKAATIYCKIKKDYPSWIGMTVKFNIEGSNNSHSLYMGGLEQQFGQACKK